MKHKWVTLVTMQSEINHQNSQYFYPSELFKKIHITMRHPVCGRPWLDRSLIYRDASSNKIKYHKVRIRPIRFNPYWPSIISFYFKRNINLSTVSLSCTFDTLFFWASWGRWLQFQQCNLNKDLRSKKMLKIFISTIFSKHIKCQTRKMTWSFFNKDFLCPLFIYCMISRLVHWVWIMFFIQ